MTLTYGFYNSSGGDRVYDALQMSSIFDGIIEDGVFATIGDKFATTENTGMQVFVGSGRAWFNHTWSYNDAPVSLTVQPADPLLPRIDAVYLEINETTRTNSFGILQGTPASTPTQPTLTNTATVHQYRLALITVPAGATLIIQGDIQNTVGWAATPWVTGPLTILDNEDQVAAWESQFMVWFDEMKDQLTVDAAGNLQTQIDALETAFDNHSHYINTADLVNFAVTNAKVATDAISTIKIMDNSITNAKMADAAISTNELANNAVDDTKVGNRVPMLTRRRGGNSTDWNADGGTVYTPTAVKMQVGSNTNSQGTYNSVTFPQAFSGRPVVFAQYYSEELELDKMVVVDGVSTTGFAYRVPRRADGATAIGESIFWLAIGPE